MAGVMTNPWVRVAIARACEKRSRRERRKRVEEALQQAGSATLLELADATEMGIPDLGPALDALRIAGRVEMDGQVFRWL